MSVLKWIEFVFAFLVAFTPALKKMARWLIDMLDEKEDPKTGKLLSGEEKAKCFEAEALKRYRGLTGAWPSQKELTRLCEWSLQKRNKRKWVSARAEESGLIKFYDKGKKENA